MGWVLQPGPKVLTATTTTTASTDFPSIPSTPFDTLPEQSYGRQERLFFPYTQKRQKWISLSTFGRPRAHHSLCNLTQHSITNHNANPWWWWMPWGFIHPLQNCLWWYWIVGHHPNLLWPIPRFPVLQIIIFWYFHIPLVGKNVIPSTLQVSKRIMFNSHFHPPGLEMTMPNPSLHFILHPSHTHHLCHSLWWIFWATTNRFWCQYHANVSLGNEFTQKKKKTQPNWPNWSILLFFHFLHQKSAMPVIPFLTHFGTLASHCKLEFDAEIDGFYSICEW